jgi:hypothetical protein
VQRRRYDARLVAHGFLASKSRVPYGVTGSNWIPVNWADTILHLALGVGMVATGVQLSRAVVRRTAPAV